MKKYQELKIGKLKLQKPIFQGGMGIGVSLSGLAGAVAKAGGAGLPADLPALVKDSEIKIAPVVSTEKAVSVILRYWSKKYNRIPDFIIIEGPEAGGHLGFHREEIEKYQSGESTDTYTSEVRKIIAKFMSMKKNMMEKYRSFSQAELVTEKRLRKHLQ